ncbi:MAG TPA: SDR family oxidoreductase [Tepidisphaeraceae bacterium]|nr:SDR family oxidoreductase [Tepidisphaeraceae bacterium]
MPVRLKPLSEQVVVITGASSGIGLVTARLAAQRGAKLVLVARSEQALRHLEEELNNAGHEALAVVADVGDQDDVRRVAEAAVTRFGGFDTWINNAGISIFGRLTHVPSEDHHRLFQTNFWGLVNGSLTAVGYLKGRGGGAIINIGSALSDRAIPVQGMYSASKHAVKGFTDALRMELEEEGAPISVTLIKPSSINTPFTRHAKNYMPNQAEVPAPVYAPDVVARTIVYCCEHAERDVFVGSAGKMVSALGHHAPRATDVYMERALFEAQQKESDAPEARGRHDALFAPSEDLSERGDYEGMVRETSVYTKASLHPWISAGIVLGVGVLATALLSGSRRA